MKDVNYKDNPYGSRANAYVGGDAYNYMINANFASEYYDDEYKPTDFFLP